MNVLFIILLVMLAAITYFHYTQGLFSSTLSAIFAVVAAIVAFSYHETIVESLLAGKVANSAHGMLLMILFAVIYMTLRLISDAAIPGQIRLPDIVDKIGGAVMGLVAGVFALGIVAIAAQELPFGPDIAGYDRYVTADHKQTIPGSSTSRGRDGMVYDELKSDEPGQFAAEDRHSVWFDDAVVSAVSYLSNGGSVAGEQPLSSVHPALLDELFGQRIGVEPGGKRVAMDLPKQHLQDAVVRGVYRVESVVSKDSEQKEIRPSFTSKVEKTITAGKDDALLIVRTQFLHSAADDDGLFRVSPGAIRLYVPGDGADLPPADYFPIGAMNDKIMYADKMDDPLFVNVRDKDRGADLVFRVKRQGLFQGKTSKLADGVFIEVKRLAREDLSGKTVALGLPPPDYDYWMMRKVTVAPPPPKDAVSGPRPEQKPTPSPVPPPAPANPAAPTPAQNPAEVHPNSPQSVVASTANQIFVFAGAKASSDLPIPIGVSGDVSKLSVLLSGGDAILKANKFVSLNVDVSDTVTNLKKGARQITQLIAPPDQGLLQVQGTSPGESWNWGEKADQFEVIDAANKHYKANGVWALVQDGADGKFFARYSTDYPLSPITPQDGKVTQLWFCFGVPPNVEIKQLVMGATVIADLNGVKVPAQK